MFSLLDLSSRHPAARLAAALNAAADVVDVMLGGTPPPGREAEVNALAAEARVRVDAAIEDAVGEVQSAVCQRYDWETVEDAPLVRRLVADRALFHLHGEVVPQHLDELRRNSLVLLGAVRKGGRSLTDADGAPYPTRARSVGRAVMDAEPAGY